MKGYFYLLLMVILTAAGQLLTKKGAESFNFDSNYLSSIRTFVNGYIIAAFLLIMIVPLFYILALRDLDLSVAFAFTGLNYVLVSLGGKAIFGEKLNGYHYAGMICIVAGLLVFHL